MCERCAGGMVFFGLAEPQQAMVPAYKAALQTGWQPLAGVPATETLAALAENTAQFLAARADRVEKITAAGGETVRYAKLVRWLWDGDFCGEVELSYGMSGALAALACSIVAGKRDHGYEDRALRQLTDEALSFGIPVAPHEGRRERPA